MNHSTCFNIRRTLSLCSFALLLTLFVSQVPLQAQTQMIENGLAAVHVTTDQKSGRFWFSTGPNHGYARLTYKGAGVSTTITSNLVFRVQRGTLVSWYCNTPNNMGNGGYRPQTPNGPAIYQPYDSLYRSPSGDTIEVIYRNLNVFDITVRFIAEKPRHKYDDGGDIVMEFDYRTNSFAPPGSSLGIFMMLDQDNGTITTAPGSDKSSIMTDRGYYPSYDVGGVFQKNFGGIPEFYMTGWFETTTPLHQVFSIHRLTGNSLSGKPLTPPDELAIGRWQDLATTSWLMPGAVNSTTINDAATAMRWENLGTAGLVRTSFGLSSKGGNNIYTCRDTSIFVMMRSERVIRQANVGGLFKPDQFNVEMWVTNVNTRFDRRPLIQLVTPIRSYPANDGRLKLDPSTQATHDIALKPKETKKFNYLINVDQSSADSLAELRLLYRDTADKGTKPLRPMAEGCIPLINLEKAFVPPPPVDDRPPVLDKLGAGRDATQWWTLRAYDRHANFLYDSGLDRIQVTRNDANNMRLITSPANFRRCDTTVTLDLRVEVIDTTKPGHLEFTLYDCKGNTRSSEAFVYQPRPDLFVPSVTKVDSIGRFNAQLYPCHVPIFEVYVEDQANQRPDAGDLGFGAIEVLSSTNFKEIEINFDESGSPISAYDKTASFRLTVEDSMQAGVAIVRVVDIAGNADTLNFNYCPVPDFNQPEIKVAPGPTTGVSWTVEGTDNREWDRGVAEVVELSRLNMTLNPWPMTFAPGDPVTGPLDISVTDPAWPAEVTLELRDMWYDQNDPSTFAEHSERITLSYSGVIDTLAPNVSINRNLSVAANRVVFDIAINDTHYVNNVLYPFDRGLQNVTWTLSPNMTVLTPIVFTDNRRGASFQVEVVDPLAIVEGDTVCVQAVDSAGNTSGDCQIWPSVPDGKSPIVIGALNDARTELSATITDSRESDRGLGSILLRNEVNLAPFAKTDLNGSPSETITLTVIDPTKPISGELVVTDLYGIQAGIEADPYHTVVLPFEIPVVELRLELPTVVEPGSLFRIPIILENDVEGELVQELSFGFDHSANGVAAGGSTVATGANFLLSPLAGGGSVAISLDAGDRLSAGDTVAYFEVEAATPTNWETFTFEIDPATIEINNGRGVVIEYTAPGDPITSTITLPRPLVRIDADSMTVINGDCNRLLVSEAGLLRPGGLQLLSVHPNPISSDGTLRLYVRDLPEHGSIARLYSAEGNVVDQWQMDRGAIGISELVFPLSSSVSSGLYVIRIEGAGETTQMKVIVQ